MFKLKPIYLNGKKFIQLSQLPIRQANALLSWLPGKSIVRLINDGVELEDCIDYCNYEYWFDTYFKKREFELEF